MREIIKKKRYLGMLLMASIVVLSLSLSTCGGDGGSTTGTGAALSGSAK